MINHKHAVGQLAAAVYHTYVDPAFITVAVRISRKPAVHVKSIVGMPLTKYRDIAEESATMTDCVLCCAVLLAGSQGQAR